MLKRFQKYSFSSIYITVIIAILIWLGTFINPQGEEINALHSPLFDLFNHWFNILGQGKIFVTFILLLLQALLIASFSNKHKTFGKNTLIAGVVLIILSAPQQIQTFNAIILTNIFVILAFGIFLKAIPQKKSSREFFAASILLAIASLIYFQYILLPIFAVISVIIIRSKITKEVFAVILGFLTIYLLYAELFYLTQNQGVNLNLISDVLNHSAIKFQNSIYFIIYLSFIGVIFLAANSHILKTITQKEIDDRTIFQLTFAFFVFTIITFIFIPNVGISFFASMAIPLTFLFGNYFSNIKDKRFNKMLFFLFLLSGFVFYIENLLNLLQ
jgi:Family of unknown function (DUF6427)